MTGTSPNFTRYTISSPPMKEGTIQHKIQEIKYMTDNRHAGGCSHHSVSTKEHLKKKIKLYKTHFQTKSELMFY